MRIESHCDVLGFPCPLFVLQGISGSIMSEHIRAVRMIIKHFHFFSNSIKPAQPSPLDALRRCDYFTSASIDTTLITIEMTLLNVKI